MPAQEPVLSFPSSASLDALAGHFFDGSEHRARTPAVACAHPLFRSDDAAAEGSLDVAFDSTTLFYWTNLPPRCRPLHAEPPLVIDHDGEGVPDQYKQSESFELVSPPPISAVNGGGGITTSVRMLGRPIYWTYPVVFSASGFALAFLSPRSCACFCSPRAGWVNRRTCTPLHRVLQPLRELEPQVHGNGVGIRGSAAQRASSWDDHFGSTNQHSTVILVRIDK